MSIYIPFLQIREKATLVYYQYQDNGKTPKSHQRIQNMRNITKGKYLGIMTAGTKKRLSKAISLLVMATKKRKIWNEIINKKVDHQLSFITLTISDPGKKLTGKEAYRKLLEPFIAWMRKTLKINTYIWKAELQKNGQIHYHITTPTFINCHKLREKWNNLQRSAGLLDKYYLQQNHYNANSTDIKSVKSKKNMANYLIKEICKSIQNQSSIGGKVWDCSNNLSKAKYYSTAWTQEHEDFIQRAVVNNLASNVIHEQFVLTKFMEQPDEYILSKRELEASRKHHHQIASSIKYHNEKIF